MNTERKLATIQEVKEIKPIAGADRIELACVLGWQCVVSKDSFKVGDKCVYFEIDSFLPIEDRYEILKNNSYKNSPKMGEGYRIKTQTFRGSISQGFILPLSEFPELSEPITIGTDLTETLGVKLWEVEEKSDLGNIIGSLPGYVHKTEEYRIQSYPELIQELWGKPYYSTLKVDGTSTTYIAIDDERRYCGHECELAFDDKYKYKDFVEKAKIFERIKEAGYNKVVVQGELAGPGIRKNTYGLKEVAFFVFNVMDIQTGENFNYDQLLEFIDKTGLTMVPIYDAGMSFEYTIEELLEAANNAKYSTGRRAEGIVVRAQDNIKSQALVNRKLSFKVLSNKYLLKNED